MPPQLDRALTIRHQPPDLHGFPRRIDGWQVALGRERDDARSLLECGGVAGHDEPIGTLGDDGGERALDLSGASELETLEADTEGLGGALDIVHLRGNPGIGRSEERRVGKECRSRWSPYH